MEVTVTSRLHRQKDTERQRKTEENREGEALTRKIAGEPERGRGMREMEVTAAGLKQENGDQT